MLSEISGLNFDLISRQSFALTSFAKRMFLYISFQNSIERAEEKGIGMTTFAFPLS